MKTRIITTLTMALILVSATAHAGWFSSEPTNPVPMKTIQETRGICEEVVDYFNAHAIKSIGDAGVSVDSYQATIIKLETLKAAFENAGYSLDATAASYFSQRNPAFWLNITRTGMTHLLMLPVQLAEYPKGEKLMLEHGFTQETVDIIKLYRKEMTSN